MMKRMIGFVLLLAALAAGASTIGPGGAPGCVNYPNCVVARVK